MKNNIIPIAAALCLLLAANVLEAQQPKLSHWRPYDQNGINLFEDQKSNYVEFEGLKVRVGGHFTQQFQALKHSNQALEIDANNDGKNDNELIGLSPGFNLATANLNIDAQLADGVRLNLITYLSSRHHPEAWVKGGFIQFDKLSFLNSNLLDQIMEKVTIRVGHMEVNYGDAHFRRTDNGNAMYNPFVGNYILDAFTTEIGGELYFQSNGFIGMFGMTGGEIRGDVVRPAVNEVDNLAKRSPAMLGKLGFDKQLSEDFRLRLTGSVYHTPSSARNTLYAGDRAGSRYYLVLEPTTATTAANFTSGRFNPVFTDRLTSFMANAFLKYRGLELFGTFETSDGRTHAEVNTRNVNQFAGDVVYRFGKSENLFVGGRYNKVNATLLGSRQEVSLDRIQAGAGWFLTPNILLKAEYVNQNYNDFLPADIRHQGRFNGMMVEAVVGF